ncbi:DUF4129 domain-containing protein [Cellulomonas soli]|uniref:DUF4129 domain-containing protein n=1 Tax=Cellulomonas soli TaxID=931535 RepID=UPI003F82DA3C
MTSTAATRRVARVLVVALLVALVVLGATLAGPWRVGVRDLGAPAATIELPVDVEPSVPAEQGEPPVEVDVPPELPGWVRAVLTAIAVVVLVVLLAAAGRRLRPYLVADRDPTPDEGGPGEVVDADDLEVPVLRDAVHRARRALVDDVPPGDAVVAAWMALEEASARVGVVREPAQTAGELTVQVLDATHADPAAVRDLLGLYHRARYGSRPVTTEDVVRARADLARLADGLRERADAPEDA